LLAASGYARSSVSTAWTSATVPGGPDALVVTAGGTGATGGPAPKGKGAGGVGPRLFRCAATASRSALPWARISADWAGHSHTQCPRWPQNEEAPRRRGGAPVSGAPPHAPPRGGGAPPRGKRGGRSECGKTVPAREGTGVPGARVPPPRLDSVRTGYSSGRPPHAGCCCQPESTGPPRTSWRSLAGGHVGDHRGRNRRRRGPKALRSTSSTPRGRPTTRRPTTRSRCCRRGFRGYVRPEERSTLGGRPRPVPRCAIRVGQADNGSLIARF